MTLILSGTDGLSDVDGTAATPALRGTDANTGIFFPAADTIAFAEGGAEAMRIDSSGNVGIGTTSPASKLDINTGGSTGTQDLITLSGLDNASTKQTYATLRMGIENSTAGSEQGNLHLQTVESGTVRDRILLNGSGYQAFSNGGTERMRIDSSGNVGIGTSSPTNKLHVSSSSFETIKLQGTSTVSGINFVNSAANNGYIYYDNGPNMLFYTNGSERARIASDGAFLIGKTTVDDTTEGFIYRASKYLNLVRDGGPPLNVTRLTDSGEVVQIRRITTQVGSISVTASNTAFNTSSDYRLKEDIAPMTGALAKVVALKPCTYKWKVDGSDGQGFIAHELDEVVPGCVTGEKDAVQEEQYEVTPAVKDEEGNTVTEAVMGTRTVPKYQGIDTSFLVATLTAAIQEQQALITQLQADVAALKAQ